MTPLKDVDAALVAYLVDEGSDLWPDAIRLNALWEATIAVVRVRPEYHATLKELTVEADLRTFKLPDDCVSLVDVHGLLDADGNVCKQLKYKSMHELTNDKQCWRHETGDATSFVYDQTDRYSIYLVGQTTAGAKLRVLATPYIAMFTDLATDTLPIRQDAIPEIIDYAMYRLNMREDSPPGKASTSYSAFMRGNQDKLQADMARNPGTAAMKRRK